MVFKVVGGIKYQLKKDRGLKWLKNGYCWYTELLSVIWFFGYTIYRKMLTLVCCTD
jgi:hypothetical protein